MSRDPIGWFSRVGIDTGSGGDLAPIFSARRFEYIPMWGLDELETETYAEHRSQINSNKCWSDFLKPELADCKFHHDPRFGGNYTYGECPTEQKDRDRFTPQDIRRFKKMQKLERLRENDLVLFTAGLKRYPPIKNDWGPMFVIGYFTVQEAVPFYRLNKSEKNRKIEKFPQIKENAHFIEQTQLPHTKSLDTCVVIVGKPFPESQLLKQAKKISVLSKDKAGRTLKIVSKKWQRILGMKSQRSLQRSYSRTIPSECIPRLKKELGIR